MSFTAPRMPLAKRIFDVSVSLITVPVWFTVFILCILAQLVLEGRPIFYPSLRRVYGREQARTWKFRTMVRNAATIYNRNTVPVTNQRFLNTPIDSPLYTKVGRFMERCQFTELPQVFQVLAGTLSIVGNRPLPENVIASLAEVLPQTEHRFDSPCGLTGLVQLIGRETVTDADRLTLEVRYCRTVRLHYRMSLDFLILAYTILIHTRLKKGFTVEDAHRFMDRFGPRPAELLNHDAPVGAAQDLVNS